MSTRVLVVEDELIVAQDLRATLESLDYEVCAVVASGEAALEKAESLCPDLVLMDVVLAGEMMGTEAAGLIRKRFGIPVVYLTAYTDDETLAKAGVTDPAGYIVKPFQDREVRSIVEIALQKAKIDAERRQAEEALRDSEQHFREMAESVRKVFWLFDWVNQKVIYVSPAYEEIWCRSVQDLDDRPEEWSDSIHPDDRDSAAQSFAKIAETGGGEEREYRIVRPDGSIRWISDEGFAVYDESGSVYRIAGVAVDITAHRLVLEGLRKSRDDMESQVEAATGDLRAANESLKREIEERQRAEEETQAEQRLLRRMLAVQERDRKIVAHDIHDDLVQCAVAAHMQLEAARRTMGPQSESVERRLGKLSQLLQRVAVEGRRIVNEQSSVVIDNEGVVHAIRDLVAERNTPDTLEVAFYHDVQFDRLDPMLENTVFRIVQECLNGSVSGL